MAVKIIMLLVFIAVTIFIGFYSRKKMMSNKTSEGFVLGGRSVGPWLSAFAYGTSYFSAVIFVGYAGQFGWKFGVAALWIGIGNALIGSLLAWVVLGRRTRLMSQKLESATMPDFFGKRFNSKALKIAASFIVFIFLIPYTASLYNGLSRLFSVGFNIPFEVCIIVMAVITGIYVIVGGFMATAINDFIQGIIMIFGIIAVVVAVLNINGGFTGSMNAILALDPATTDSSIPGIYGSIFGADPVSLLFIVIFTSLGTWGLPQMVQKFYAIKDEHQIKKGTIISTLFALIVAGGCYFLGGFGRLFASAAEYSSSGAIIYDSIIPAMVSQLPNILVAVVIVLVLAASMSTLSSLVLSSSSTLTLDFVQGTIVKDMTEKKKMTWMRIFIVVFIVISAAIAIYQSNSTVTFIAQLMGISWGALAGAFLAPFLYGLYYKKTSKASVWACFAFGVGFMCLNLFGKAILPTFLKSPINCGVIAMLAGFVIVPLVSLFTKAPAKEAVDEMFNCYNKVVVGPAKDFLGETEEVNAN